MSELKQSQSSVNVRLFALMADEYIIIKLFLRKEDADNALKAYEREHEGALFFVEEVSVH